MRKPWRDARRLARKEKLDVEFVLADMRRFRRPGAFDAVINMFTAFGYFKRPADDLRVLKQAGFARVKVFGNLDGAPYNQDAQRLMTVARKV